jgi:hypothetical protein
VILQHWRQPGTNFRLWLKKRTKELLVAPVNARVILEETRHIDVAAGFRQFTRRILLDRPFSIDPDRLQQTRDGAIVVAEQVLPDPWRGLNFHALFLRVHAQKGVLKDLVTKAPVATEVAHPDHRLAR